MKALSSRQAEIMEFIRKEVDSKGYPPSVREIGEAVGLSSTSTVHGHLTRLEEKGYIRRDQTKPRAIELVGDSALKKATMVVPVVGRVTAGQPILAVENIEDYFPLPTGFLAGDGEVFMLIVRGNSMINAGILDGDYVIVRRQSTANNGEIVVALVDEEEATIKRIYREPDRVRLQPENPEMDPIYSRTVDVLGKVIGVIRRL